MSAHVLWSPYSFSQIHKYDISPRTSIPFDCPDSIHRHTVNCPVADSRGRVLSRLPLFALLLRYTTLKQLVDMVRGTVDALIPGQPDCRNDRCNKDR
jgi:hypothetical protein